MRHCPPTVSSWNSAVTVLPCGAAVWRPSSSTVAAALAVMRTVVGLTSTVAGGAASARSTSEASGFHASLTEAVRKARALS